ncbi:unnamed protein product [Parnassius apollo]|uniref:(apollo) hypothetical protein n=1 Tax=Parnassius apollo TaxID=110799 RepID=A0A8S3X6N7_PARAO|nr:unnamed protein product [Parnassius apollo]
MFHQRLKEGLPQLVKNREVLAIFNTQAQAEEEKLKNDLLAIRPVSPTNYCARFGSYQTLGTLRRKTFFTGCVSYWNGTGSIVIPTAMALVLEKKCFIWELPPETFDLESCTYKGIPLAKVIENVTQVEDRRLVPTNVEICPRVSYSVHMAHKLAAWIIHIRGEQFVTSLENSAIGESVSDSFLNLTEFRGMMIDTLIPCLVFYLMIYDKEFFSKRVTHFDSIYAPKKTAYDVLLDTIMSRGKAGDLYAFAGCPGFWTREGSQDSIIPLFDKISICNTQAGDGEPIEGPRCVHGPEAWLEGLRQKGWTLATILIVLLAAHRCDTTASLLGQGDNQVIVLRIPSQRYVQERKLTPDEYTKQFLRVLEDICTASGIVIKVPESWRFRRLLEYGRRYYLDGVQVSGALKKASRFTSEANQTIHTTNALIAGLFSSGTSVEGDDETPLPAYMMTVFEAARVLWKRHAEH